MMHCAILRHVVMRCAMLASDASHVFQGTCWCALIASIMVLDTVQGGSQQAFVSTAAA